MTTPPSSPNRPDLSPLRIHDQARNDAEGQGRTIWIVAATAIAALLALVPFLVLRRGIPVEVAAARSAPASAAGSAPTLLNASGYVTPRRRATVAAKITGRVEQVYAEEGMTVTEGQVLATIDPSEARVRLHAAETARDAAAASIRELDVNLANARRELDRARDLETKGISSTQALDSARTAAEALVARIAVAREQIRAAEATVAVARQDLDNCTVRAPFGGIVVSKDAQRGEMVSPVSAGGGFTRTGIATIVDMASLEIEVDVNESYIAKVREGQRVEAALDAWPEWKIPAKVRTVIPTADRQKATVKVRIGFDTLDPRILPDMGVKVSFLGEASSPSGSGSAASVLVPVRALRDAKEGKGVVFVVRGGRAERRAVGVAATEGDDARIAGGLAVGEQVVVSGGEKLEDGAKVDVQTAGR